MTQVSHDSPRVDVEPVAIHIRSSSDLSGTTLDDSLDLEQDEFDTVLLEDAEQADQNLDQRRRGLSPSVYYDDPDLEESLNEQLRIIYEQLQLIEAAEHYSYLSPSLYYEDLPKFVDKQEQSQEQFLAGQASEQEMGLELKTENRAMGAAVSYQSPNIQPQRTQIPQSSHPISGSALAPTRINLETDLSEKRSQRLSTPALYLAPLPSISDKANLRHPFRTAHSEPNINDAVPTSESDFAESIRSETPSRDTEKQPFEARPSQPLASAKLDFENQAPQSLVQEVSDTIDALLKPPAGHDAELQRLKRVLNDDDEENGQEGVKRVQFDDDIYELPVSPGANGTHRKAISTDTTAVNTEHPSPDRCVPIDYQKVMYFVVNTEDRRIEFPCHEFRVCQISAFVQAYRDTHRDEVLRLRPQDEVHSIKAQTVHYFMRWLYDNRFTDPEEEQLDFGPLLELYYFSHAYAVIVLKNVLIDHLVNRFALCQVPLGQTKKIYKNTERGDQLRRLWIDVYIWEMEEPRFQKELESGKLDPTFLQDLALAQMQRLRRLRQHTGIGAPPYQSSKTTYHKRDEKTGLCCRRKQFEGEGLHRQDHDTTHLKSLLEKLQSRLEALKRKESENTNLRRNLRKMQLKLSQSEMKLRNHVSIDHAKLMRRGTWDNPEIMNPDVMRKDRIVSRLQV